MEADHPRFTDALDALDAGDPARLGALLREHPDLVRARATSDEPPYEGYFHGATLLHHVAGNPIRGSLPDNIVEVARTLLEAGAEPDAGCGGGPAQPGPAGGTTLGLVVTGAQAHIQGATQGLMDLLIEHGAALNPEAGMFGTLYHTVEHHGQREVARMLYARGVEADLPTAAGLGYLDLVQSFLNSDGRPVPDADRIWRRSRGGTAGTPDQVLGDALVAAAANGWPDVVAFLADQGAPLDQLRPWGAFPVTALHAAAWAGWPDVAALLVDLGADRSATEPTFGGTPLDWARHSDRGDVVEVLERCRAMSGAEAAFRGAVEAVDAERVLELLSRHPRLKEVLDAPVFAFGAQALVYASSCRDRALIGALLDAGADVNAKSDWAAGGFTALHHQVGSSAHPKPELAELLIERGAEIDLHAAAGLGRLDLVSAILDEEPDRVSEPGPDGVTPLHLALTVEMAALLLERGAQLDKRDVDHNSTPAMWAVDERHDVLRYLLERGAEADLFMAAVLNDPALAAGVLEADPAAIRSRVREGRFAHPPEGGDIYIWKLDFVDLPTEVARRAGHEGVYRALLERSPRSVRLLQAAREGDSGKVGRILDEEPGLLPGLSPPELWPLMCLGPEFLTVLLKAGGDPNVLNGDGVTPLHEAAWNGDLETVRFLVEHGADPAARDTNHDATPLGWALYGRKKEIVEYLARNTPVDVLDGITLGMTDHVLGLLDEDPTRARALGGASPIRTAAYLGNAALVRRMLELGADPALPNPETGKSALDLARECGHDPVVALLDGGSG